MTVSDLFDNEGDLKNWETLSQELNLNPIHFLNSIPRGCKKTLKGYNTEDNIVSEEESQCGIEANGKFIPLNSVTAKLVYKLHVSRKVFSSPPPANHHFKETLIKIIKIFGHQFIYYLLV